MKRLLQFVALLAAAGLWPTGQSGGLSSLFAQGSGAIEINPRTFIQLAVPEDSPVKVVSVNYGASKITRTASGMVMDLDLALTVRNRSEKTVEGLALALGYSERREGLNAVSGIHLASGESYTLPVRMKAEIELPPATPARATELPTSLRVRVDGVLFADGTGYGTDRMQSLAAMRVTQSESARDRRFFQELIQSRGLPLLVNFLEKLGAAPAQRMAATAAPRALAGEEAERARALAQWADFRVMRFEDAPVEVVSARARVYDRGLVDPALEVRNLAGREIADFQVAWLLRDASGAEFRVATFAGSASGAGRSRFRLSAGESLDWRDPAVIEAAPAVSGPILSGRVYLRAVQFANGQVWVPRRAALEAAGLSPSVADSPETIRLLRVYRGRGKDALAADLRR